MLYPGAAPAGQAAEWGRPALGPGRGRHRKPTAAEERDR
ncbi:hypothetical protein [Streptomyces tanashiensis]